MMAALSGPGETAPPTVSTMPDFVPFHERIRKCLPAWKEIGAPPQVLRWLREGYKLPFNRHLPKFHHASWIPNTQQEWEVLREMRDKLLRDGVVIPAESRDFVSRSRLEPKKDGGFRLIVDLRFVNKHIASTTCKYEGLSQLEHVLRPADFMVSFDLKSGYYHVPIHRSHVRYITTELAGTLVSFQALPFGLSTAPRVFTKVMRPFVAALRKQGIRVLPYIDDFLLMSGDKAQSLRDREEADRLIRALGLTRNPEKGYWEPTQNLIHLGIGIDTMRELFLIPPEKMKTLKSAARSLVVYAKSHRRWVSAKKLANFVGLAMSLRLALQQVRTYTRSLYDALSDKRATSTDVKLTALALKDLQFFVELDETWNGLAIWHPQKGAVMHTDASDYGWGAVLDELVPARGFFNQEQLRQHITEKELRAVWFGLQAFNKHLGEVMRRRAALQLITDNQVVQSVVNKGVSRSHRLMPLVRKIQAFCKLHGLQILAKYIPSEENVQADALSRQLDKSDWTVSDPFLHRVQERWGRRTVDRFATPQNAICQRYNTWHSEPNSLGDAFEQQWTGERNWVNPPWALIPKVISKLKAEPTEAVILLPYWPSANWFPDLVALMDDHVVLTAREVREIVVASNPAVPEPLRNPRWRLIVAHIPARRRM